MESISRSLKIIVPLLFITFCVLLSGCHSIVTVYTPEIAQTTGQKSPLSDGEELPVVCENPVYPTIVWTETTYHSEYPLYVATLPAPESIQEKVQSLSEQKSSSEENLSLPVSVFTTIGDDLERQGQVGTRFWVFEQGEQSITSIFFLTSQNGTVHLSSSPAYIGPILSLASKTSETTPMHLVSSGHFMYAVIGDTAYCISEKEQSRLPEALPELNLGEAKCTTTKIMCGNH